MPSQDMFLAYIHKTDGCWLWLGTLDRDGYGHWHRRDEKRSNVRAHREMWERLNGPIPPGMQVLHSCDNPPCVNPDHLWLGTGQDNRLDAYRKGRQRPGKGRLLGPEKTAELMAARAAGARLVDLAKQYGITPRPGERPTAAPGSGAGVNS